MYGVGTSVLIHGFTFKELNCVEYELYIDMQRTVNNHFTSFPLVSVVIPCYNHGRYLATAVESVNNQTYPATEIVVVDDGSADNTRQIAQRYGHVVYVYQPNQGLAASRNTGIVNCKGEYIVFLDADDWLYPDAITINMRYFQHHPEAAFISGAYANVYEKENTVEQCKLEVPTAHYRRFLGFNYIGMIAAVMYKRWILDEFRFDVSLRACEDHDLYLRISRKHPVVHHTEIIAAYRRHGSNMSGNVSVMLTAALKVLKQQRKELKTNEEIKTYKRSYHSLYKQFFSTSCGTGEQDIFREDNYTFYKYKFLYTLKKITKFR